MARILLVYYSRTGITRLVAKEIARHCACDVEEIHEAQARDGTMGYVRSLIDVLAKRQPPIEAVRKDPAVYDLVILGTPVWASDICSPIRTYLAQNQGKFKRIAAFCTMGGRGGEKALEHLASLAGSDPAAHLVLTRAEIESASFGAKTKAFAAELSALFVAA